VPRPGASNHVQRVDSRQRRKRARAIGRRQIRSEQPLELGDRHVSELERLALICL
jgi:hypothetical protein